MKLSTLERALAARHRLRFAEIERREFVEKFDLYSIPDESGRLGGVPSVMQGLLTAEERTAIRAIVVAACDRVEAEARRELAACGIEDDDATPAPPPDWHGVKAGGDR